MPPDTADASPGPALRSTVQALPPPEVTTDTHQERTVQVRLDAGSLPLEADVDHYLLIVAKHDLVNKTKMQPSTVKIQDVSATAALRPHGNVHDVYMCTYERTCACGSNIAV